MNRREMITTGVGLGLLAAGPVLAEKAAGAAPKPPSPSLRDALIAATADCEREGAVCAAHCAGELAKGNKEFAHCAASVNDMRAMVQAMLTLASSGSALAKKVAPLCAEACKTCAAACLEHKAHWEHGMHLACKSCFEACGVCEKACTAFAASA